MKDLNPQFIILTRVYADGSQDEAEKATLKYRYI
jgi:hypothetical protein